MNPMNDPRLSKLYSVMKRDGLDAVAFVPGPNFRKLFSQDFHLMERPLVVIVPSVGAPVAIVPNLEMASFAHLSFPGEVFDWRDEVGFTDAFRAAAAALPQIANGRIGLEAQRMRAFEMMELQSVFPAATLVDAHGAISSVRLHKDPSEVDLLRHAIRISEAALEETLQTVAIGQTEKRSRPSCCAPCLQMAQMACRLIRSLRQGITPPNPTPTHAPITKSKRAMPC
jgi:Xaa-Pro dipeptidase